MPATSSADTGRRAARVETAPDRPQLLFFYSLTSGSSRRTEGFLAQVLQRRGNHQAFKLHRIDADQYPQLVERFRIDTIPALVVVENKHVRARLASPRGCAQIRETLAPWLS
jgi:thioredoxin-like negative regulator of GroEL